MEISGKVAVVTGGAGGIGRGIVEALLDRGAKVVVADIEKRALDDVVAELADRGEVIGRVTDVSDFESVEALADEVYDRHGACHLLFNNAGVTSGGGGKPWEQEINDWKWCFSVNVFGVANGMLAFVPRMLEGGEEGRVVNTSSADGGFAPVPHASVYASSKAAVSCLTEALAHQLIASDALVRASVFYPGGGFLETGLWTAQRNRPEQLARIRERAAAPGTTIEDFKRMMADAGKELHLVDLAELGRSVVDDVEADRYIIGSGLADTAALLRRRADAIERGELPPTIDLGI